MAGQLTVVTGGSRGIGAAICRRLAAEGQDVVITYLRDSDAADEVAADVRRLGQRALVLQTDTTEEHSVVELFDRAQAFGPLTGLVNNAGSASAVGPLEGNSLQAISQDLNVNLLGVISCIKYAIGPMSQAGGGSIVNISSAAATLGGAGTYVHYAAAKAAVEALTVGLSKELAGKNIRVNAVAPGTLWTDFHQDPDRPAKIAPTIPMGRAGQPHEIAGAVAWLLSDDASYATGATIRIAGGL
ncbi:SDR family NAD(P)-dependent oxidoreductase [Arthrobacter sp. Leaf69]|uniref:SDR family NAD(P)-dependent oxidoreductase n=1 Tax=Arthrobacter sp. Leaf69 TaxID=1736232 RepID=UPI0006F43653|nr:SDR family NAD(P)-dependent oxidoreductase [Arthrobacter sp. Leaf69]KQN93365.1 oxidoreductase [Arthrobacter sp. Leaf69]